MVCRVGSVCGVDSVSSFFSGVCGDGSIRKVWDGGGIDGGIRGICNNNQQ